jgi:hypothetical protein
MMASAASSLSQADAKKPYTSSSKGNATAGTGVTATTELIRAGASIAIF